MTIKEILESQSRFFAEGGTRPVAVRRQYLRKLLEEILSREKDICRALYEDLHKTEFESRSTEIGLIQNELSTLRMRKQKAATEEILNIYSGNDYT